MSGDAAPDEMQRARRIRSGCTHHVWIAGSGSMAVNSAVVGALTEFALEVAADGGAIRWAIEVVF